MSENRRLSEFSSESEAETEPVETDESGDDSIAGTDVEAESTAAASAEPEPDDPSTSTTVEADSPPVSSGKASQQLADGETPNGTAPDAASRTGAADAPGDGSEARPGPTVTYSSDPAGGPCAECGEMSPRRWVDGDRLVCPACKDW